MKKLILLNVLFSTLLGDVQIDFAKHDALLLSAYRAKEVYQYEKALSFYEEAFTISDDNSIGEYLNAAIVAAKTNNRKSCKKWVQEAIVKKKASRKSILKFSKEELYLTTAQDVLKNYQSLLEKYYQSIENPSAYFQIQELINRDQFSRKLNSYHLQLTEEAQEKAYEKFIEAQEKKDTAAIKKYQTILFPTIKKELKDYQRKVMRHTDSLNIVKLIEITKEYGWQSQAHLLLWHQRGDYGEKNWVWNYFKPAIDAEIKAGKISPSFWAIFEDFKSIRKTGKSIYGYHPGKVDSAKVNENRKKIGLPLLTNQEINYRNNNPYGGRYF